MAAPRRAHPSTTGLVGLSARELDVLTLMSDGLTNDAIAKRSFLSVKSVEAVVRSLFLKLGLLDNPHENRRVLAVRMLLESAQSGASSWPSYASSFVGRSSELVDLERLVSESRLVTIVGPGGIGKTRLAVELVDRREPRPASTHFVDLSSVGPGGAFSAVLDSCGIAFTTAAAGWRRLTRFSTAASRLIVIDNAETSVAETRTLVARLVAIGALQLVVTSREPLAVNGERLFILPPLADADARRLLLERISDAGADVTTLEAAALTPITVSLGGMPLAIELVAGRFLSSGAHDVEARLIMLPNLLSRPGADRHASIRAALDSSYQALTPDAQRLFRLLSVLPGGFTLDNLRRALSSVWPALDETVDQLVWTSLVGFARGRYRMLEPVRQYAASLVDELGERAALESVLVRYSTELAIRVRTLISGPPERVLPLLVPDWDNCAAAIDTALSTGDVSSAVKICGSLAFWTGRRPLTGMALADRVMAALDGTEAAVDRAWALTCVGCLSSLMGELDDATDALRVACDLFEETGDRFGLMEARYWMAHTVGTPELIDAVIELAVETSSPYLEGWCYLLKAGCFLYRGPLSPGDGGSPPIYDVVSVIDRADAIADRHGFEQLRSGALCNRVEARIVEAVCTGTWSDADDLWPMIDEFERISRALEMPHNIAQAMTTRNMLRAHCGRFDEMKGSLLEPIEVAAASENRRLVIWGVLLAASVLEYERRLEEAEELVAAAAPTFVVDLDQSWMTLCVPSAALMRVALAHVDGPLLPTAELGAIVGRCRELLGTTT